MFTLMKSESKTSSVPSTPGTSAGSASHSGDYERLLLAAQHAQAAADASVAELASLRRRVAEAPRVVQQRTAELARAQASLEQAQTQAQQARDQLSSKQADAARLIDIAASAQRLLAQALINEEAGHPEAIAALANQIEAEVAPARPVSLPVSYDRNIGDDPKPWTPPSTPAAVDAQVVAYLADRDALCPSCGRSLRSNTTARCPGCRLHLSLPVLKSVAPAWYTASYALWTVRALAVGAVALCGMLAMLTLSGRGLPGCGVGSECDVAFRSPWAKLLGIPVALLAMPVFAGVLVASVGTGIAHRDPVRKRAWAWLSGLGLVITGASLWFLVVQFGLLNAVCPHCLIVNFMGIALGLIVLFQAPLNREEKLPSRAVGPITLDKPALRKLGAIGIAVLVLFIGGHLALNLGKSSRLPTQPAAAGNTGKNSEEKTGGLLMGEVDYVPPAGHSARIVPNNNATTPKKPDPATTVAPGPAPRQTPPTPPEKEPDGLLLPGLERPAAPEKPVEKSPVKSPPKNTAPEKEPEGLLLPGLEPRSENPGTPGTPGTPGPPGTPDAPESAAGKALSGLLAPRLEIKKNPESLTYYGDRPDVAIAPENATPAVPSPLAPVTKPRVPLRLLDDTFDGFLTSPLKSFDSKLIDDSGPVDPLR